MNHLLRDDSIGGFHRRFDVAFTGRQFVRDVVSEVLMYDGSSWHAVDDVNSGRYLFDFDAHMFDGVPHCILVSADNCGDGMTDKQNSVGGQYSIIRHL